MNRATSSCTIAGCNASRDPAFTFRLLFILPLVGLALRRLGFRRTYSALSLLSSPPRERHRRRPRGARSIAAATMHVNRHLLPYRGRCLQESVALWYLLRRSGHDADLLLGARMLRGPFEGHAWVELDGEALNDTNHVRDVYVSFELPPGRAQATGS